MNKIIACLSLCILFVLSLSVWLIFSLEILSSERTIVADMLQCLCKKCVKIVKFWLFTIKISLYQFIDFNEFLSQLLTALHGNLILWSDSWKRGNFLENYLRTLTCFSPKVSRLGRWLKWWAIYWSLSKDCLQIF